MANRVHKDFKLGVGRAYLTAAVYATATLLNFTSRPAKSTGRWLSNLQEELLDLQATLVDNDSLILPISGWTQDSDTYVAARARYAQLVRQLGRQVNLMRWLSFPRVE